MFLKVLHQYMIDSILPRFTINKAKLVTHFQKVTMITKQNCNSPHMHANTVEKQRFLISVSFYPTVQILSLPFDDCEEVPLKLQTEFIDLQYAEDLKSTFVSFFSHP